MRMPLYSYFLFWISIYYIYSKKAQVSDWSIEELDELSQLTLQFENSVNFIDNITTSLHNIGKNFTAL